VIEPGRWRAVLREGMKELGPGLITGAADDDPSGISTYSTAGAAFGFGTLWTTLFSFPLMAAVQYMCARVGLVTGRGLAAVLRQRYRPWVVWGACGLLVVANTVNIAADLVGMAEAAALVTGGRPIWYHCAIAAFVVVLLVMWSYRAMARTFKWLTLVLLVYVFAAVLAHPPWVEVLRGTLFPAITLDRTYLVTLVAILGTTISPYLFFWQAAQEVEEHRAGRSGTGDRSTRGPHRSLGAARRDTMFGMFVSNLIAFFIMLTTGATLFPGGQRDVQTARDAAAALQPLAGNGASLLFSLGLVGAGLLGVPVLAGSSAYAIAEAGGWPGGMDERPRQAGKFYSVIVVGTLLGMALNHLGVSGFRLLFWAAVVNGLLAPPLIVLVLLICNDGRVMGEHVNGWRLNVLGTVTAVVMTVAGGAALLAW
jgi:NRAMP (natural resistance-associated macrophage protein)-like metal ion transporter